MSEKIYPSCWEEINFDKVDLDRWTETSRLLVPNGWIIREIVIQEYYEDRMTNPTDVKVSASICFLPDPNHDWIFEK